ncbi:hypothetical protein ILUMI_25215 [Ignelater luminosus]|uniref:Endonuclease/exonuclease/phosphatase domain-containing protein n=1 Tax=Ignelater luminosus TaxID=2038154 RepID=A0A8K0C8U2_IGNLU|nr:hypothetical protein ILUMI_25215 [Ignelater luminosus]
MLYATIENKQANITVVNAYVPTKEADEENEIEIYEKIEEVCGNIPKNDILFIIGDFKAKITKKNPNSYVAGKETIQEYNNDNGDRLCNLAMATNTFVHKIIRFLSVKVDENHIEYVLISKKWERITYDVMSFRGVNCDRDHVLVTAKVKLKIIHSSSKQKQIRKNGTPRR